MMPNQDKVRKTAKTVATKQPWEQMKLTYVGHIGEIVQMSYSPPCGVGGCGDI